MKKLCTVCCLDLKFPKGYTSNKSVITKASIFSTMAHYTSYTIGGSCFLYIKSRMTIIFYYYILCKLGAIDFFRAFFKTCYTLTWSHLMCFLT